MKLRYGLLLAGILLMPTFANAKPYSHRHHHKHYSYHHHAKGHYKHFAQKHYRHRQRYAVTQTHHDNSRPHAWCGWYARKLVGNDPGVAFNLARNWARWGRAVSAGIGVMVVWSHHVGMITGYDDQKKMWIVKSGNDGHAVRERPRPVTGAIAFRAG